MEGWNKGSGEFCCGGGGGGGGEEWHGRQDRAAWHPWQVAASTAQACPGELEEYSAGMVPA